MMELSDAIQNVRRSMDARVIGQEPVKEALLLGLVAREHFYLMGEPGCAKTLLAEVAGVHTAANVLNGGAQGDRSPRGARGEPGPG